MIPPRALILPSPLEVEILSHARAALPNECCGLLIGAGEDIVTVTRIVAAANIAENPRRCFLVDPQVQFDTMRVLRLMAPGPGRDDTPQRIVGHYHSHPGGPAAPSATDLEMADDPEAVWLVVAIGSAEAIQIGAFVRPADHASFERITLSQSG